MRAPFGMRDVPGCLARSEFEVVTHWQDQEAFDAWRQSDAFRHAHRLTESMEQVPSRLVQYAVVLGQ